MAKSFFIGLGLALFGVCFFITYRLNESSEATRTEVTRLTVETEKLQRDIAALTAELSRQKEVAARDAETIRMRPLAVDDRAANQDFGGGATATTADGRTSESPQRPAAAPEIASGSEPSDETVLAAGSAYESAADGRPTPAIQEQVKVALKAIQDEEAREREERQLEQRVKRIKERLAEYAPRLNLHPNQEEGLIKVFTSNLTKVEKVWENARDGQLDRDEARTMIEEQRKSVDDEVRSILSTGQYQEYQKIIEENPRLGMLGGGGMGDQGWGQRRRVRAEGTQEQPQSETAR